MTVIESDEKTMKTSKPLEKKQALEFYSMMMLIRRFEEAAERLYQRGIVGGFVLNFLVYV